MSHHDHSHPVEAEGSGHLACSYTAVPPVRVGGASEAKQATEEVQALADAVRGDVEKHVGGSVKEYVVEQFKTQVVAGTNYTMKVRIDKDKYIHLKVFKPLGSGKEPQLTGLDKDKASGDEIGHVASL